MVKMGGLSENGRKISLNEAEKIADEIKNWLADSIEKIQVVGSVRRKKDLVGDIDLVVIEKNGKLAQKLAEKWGYQKNGKPRRSGLWNGVQIDINVADEENFGAMLMFTTGSWQLNVEQRKIAKSKGLKLNQYGLWKNGERIAGKTEEEIYEMLRLEWLGSTDRSFKEEVK